MITVTDIFSRYTKLYLTENIRGIDIVEAIEDWSNELGKPESLLTDQGKQYTSQRLREYCEDKIKKRFSSSYNPTGNSISERINIPIGVNFRINQDENIEEVIRETENSINFGFNRNIGCSPIELIKKEKSNRFP